MKVKLATGEVVDLNRGRAEQMIRSGEAEAVTDTPDPRHKFASTADIEPPVERQQEIETATEL